MKRAYLGILLLVVLLAIATGCGSEAATPAPTQVAQAPEASFTPDNDMCVVPDVVGLTQTVALSMIEDVGLQPVRYVKLEYDATVAKGAVISQSPAGGTRLQLCKEKEVNLVVSQGPLPEPTVTPKPTNTLAPPNTPTPIPTWVRPADGMTMLYVPGGSFQMGSPERDLAVDNSEFPQRAVTLKAFWIDKTEVTNAQYRLCVEAGECESPTTCDWGDPTYGDAAKDDHPVVCMDWFGADAYCRWAGAQLPTEAQWEYAWRGPQGYTYPWGNQDPDCTLANSYGCVCPSVGPYGCIADTSPVGSYPDGGSWVGALDMAGNVMEWMADWYVRNPSGTQTNPTGPTEGDYKVLRGGSIGGYGYLIRTNRLISTSEYRKYDIGFRCAGNGPGQ